jgi:hypothetical protein
MVEGVDVYVTPVDVREMEGPPRAWADGVGRYASQHSGDAGEGEWVEEEEEKEDMLELSAPSKLCWHCEDKAEVAGGDVGYTGKSGEMSFVFVRRVVIYADGYFDSSKRSFARWT